MSSYVGTSNSKEKGIMARALFISESKLKQDSLFNDNIDAKYLSHLINEQQDIVISRLLGKALYEDLQDNIIANTVSADYQTLLNDYIIPCLKYYVMTEAPYFLNYKFQNKNVAQKSSEFSQPADTAILKDMMERLSNKAEFYAENLKLFLQANSSTYPLYYNYGNGIDAYPPTRTTFTTGMYLGDADDCCGEYINGKYYKSRTDRP